jgi:hypothetical protein
MLPQLGDCRRREELSGEETCSFWKCALSETVVNGPGGLRLPFLLGLD